MNSLREGLERLTEYVEENYQKLQHMSNIPQTYRLFANNNSTLFAEKVDGRILMVVHVGGAGERSSTYTGVEEILAAPNIDDKMKKLIQRPEELIKYLESEDDVAKRKFYFAAV